MDSFSKIAKKHALNLYENHPNEVGSFLYKTNRSYYDSNGYQPTDCITYALKVISRALKETGNTEKANAVLKKGERGVDTANFLVKELGWEAVYINADINHPRDGDYKHPLAYLEQVKKNSTYYGIPVHHSMTNYRPTDKESAQEQGLWRIYKSKGLKVGQTEMNIVDYKSMKEIPFGFGLSSGGMHIWLFIHGDVYEVHWEGIGNSLYSKTALRSYSWLSGLIVVPRDSKNLLKSLPKVAAHAHE